MKRDAIERDNQSLAKRIWCLEQILRVQNYYLNAFARLKESHFYESWCLFEQAEIALLRLRPHFTEAANQYQLQFIRRHIPRYQSLYPYRLFMSPEIIYKKKLCSICDKPVSVRQPCGHQVGEIYGGEMCGRQVTEATFTCMAMVESPTQKYSVVFPQAREEGGKSDGFEYPILEYLIKRLEDPFHAWNVSWTTRRHPHWRFRNVEETAPCPCGSSRPYRDCCLSEAGVLRPHCEFLFSVHPSSDLLETEYV
jgi:hypothetical protein